MSTVVVRVTSGVAGESDVVLPAGESPQDCPLIARARQAGAVGRRRRRKKSPSQESIESLSTATRLPYRLSLWPAAIRSIDCATAEPATRPKISGASIAERASAA